MQCSFGGGGVEEEKGREGSVEGEKKEEERKKDREEGVYYRWCQTQKKRGIRGDWALWVRSWDGFAVVCFLSGGRFPSHTHGPSLSIQFTK